MYLQQLQFSSAAVLVLLGMLLSSALAAHEEDDWRRCVVTMGNHVALDGSWREGNPCRIEPLSRESLAGSIYERNTKTSVVFGGDSLGLRAFIYGVNEFFPPNNVPAVVKVASVPDRWAFHSYNPPLKRVEVDNAGVALDESSSALVGRPRASITFLNLRYVYYAHTVVAAEILQACQYAPAGRPGVIFLTFGNWDLNWKLQKNINVPGLSPNTLDGAVSYWTKYVALLFAEADEAMSKCRGSKNGVPPLLIIREQFIPNCNAARFKGSKNKYRRCRPFLAPTVVPLYRRVLSGVAWSYNVPVIPVDHLFVDGSACTMSDGLHLDGPCMMVEQQHYWATYKHLVSHNVSQGLHPSLQGVPPNAKAFVNIMEFYEHLHTLGLEKYYKGEQTHASFYGNNVAAASGGNSSTGHVSTTVPEQLDVETSEPIKSAKLGDFTEAPLTLSSLHPFSAVSGDTRQIPSSLVRLDFVVTAVVVGLLCGVAWVCQSRCRRARSQA